MHLVRHSLFYVSHKDRKEVATDLKYIYQASTLDEADYQLSKFAEKWTTAYPMVVRSWQQNWASHSNILVRAGNQASDLHDEHD